MDKYTTQELEQELLSRYGNLLETVIDKELEDKIFKELKGIDGLPAYLQATMNKDIVRYFTTQEDNSRDMVRGAFSRTLYLKNKIKSKSSLTKEDNKRYK